MKVGIETAIDFIFKKSLGRLKYFRTFSPGIEILEKSNLLVRNILKEELRRFNENAGRPKFLDVGARDAARENYADGYDYTAMDVSPRSEKVLIGDICNCPQVGSGTFDVVFSMDVLEHLRRPWDAAEECIRITKPGGLLIHRTLFAYRYHPEPLDYWRFSSQCLEYLFTNTGQTSTLIKGYDLGGRRRNRAGVYLNDKPPIDWLGGFRENWQVLWIGRRLAGDKRKASPSGRRR